MKWMLNWSSFWYPQKRFKKCNDKIQFHKPDIKCTFFNLFWGCVYVPVGVNKAVQVFGSVSLLIILCLNNCPCDLICKSTVENSTLNVYSCPNSAEIFFSYSSTFVSEISSLSSDCFGALYLSLVSPCVSIPFSLSGKKNQWSTKP